MKQKLAIQKDIEFFDRKGFVPSRKVKTLDDYLQESVDKLELIENFKNNSQDFISEHLGIDTNIEVLLPSEGWQKRFYEIFLTEPLPGIYASSIDVRKIMTSHSLFQKTKYWLGCRLISLGFRGTILDFGDKNLNTYIPIIKKGEKDDNEEASEWLCHETVHCVRSQRLGLRLRDVLGYGSVEETIAYTIDDISDTNIALNFLPPIIQGVILSPILLGAHFFYPIANISTFSVIGMSLYYGNKTATFFNKCEKEELNPHYMFLRSNPSEYSKKEPIRDQLYKNNNVRFKIMANRLGIN